MEKLAAALWWRFDLMRQFVAIFSSHGVPDSHHYGDTVNLSRCFYCPAILTLCVNPQKEVEKKKRRREEDARENLDVFGRPLLVRLPMSADRHRGRAVQRVQSSIVQTLQLSFPGSPPRSCCVQSQDGTDGAHLPWAEGARPVKWLGLLEVPGLRAG
jgi:hypothetical protein